MNSALGLALIVGDLAARASALQGAVLPFLEGIAVPPSMRVDQEDLGSYMRGIDARAVSLQASGRRPVILHIGAAGMGGAMDRRFHGEVSAMPFAQGTGSYHVVAVEPKASNAARIRDNNRRFHKYRDEALTVVPSIIEAHCPERTTLYWIDPRVAVDFLPACPETIKYMTSESSMSEKDVYQSMEGYLKWNGQNTKILSQECRSGFQRLVNAANRSSYVLAAPVDCHTAGSLMEAIDVRPDELVGVVIDAEGVDIAIVKDLLTLEGFAPEFLQFEAQWLQTPGELKRSLKQRGYTLGVGLEKDAGSPSVVRNIIAVRRE